MTPDRTPCPRVRLRDRHPLAGLAGALALAGVAGTSTFAVPEAESNLDPKATAHLVASISPAEIHAEVTHLASDEFYGRFFRSPMAFTAAEWIRDRFQAAGLRPGVPAALGRATVEPPETSRTTDDGDPKDGMPETAPDRVAQDPVWFQPIPDPTAAPNVVGVLPSNGPSLGAILVTAHYDHLPPRRRGEDRIYNGADDNASGTCGMIAVARALASLPGGLACDVVFVAFTGEEAGLKGARHFVDRPTVPLDSIRGLFNLDMISRGDANTIFVDGAEVSEPIRQALRVANGTIGLDIRFDEHPDWLSRSDQGPFLDRKVPAVLFSVEDHEDYHQVTDHADRIIPDLAAKVSRLVAIAVAEMAATAKEVSNSAIQPPAADRPMEFGTEKPAPEAPSR